MRMERYEINKGRNGANKKKGIPLCIQRAFSKNIFKYYNICYGIANF
jgi:hypothetical protein